MKLFGDITQEEAKLGTDLVELEKFYDDRQKDSRLTDCAMGYIAIAHDWYVLYMEEEGDRLIRKAASLCPGYFYAPIFIDMDKDREFAILVEAVYKEFAKDLMDELGYGE